jgi:hypothetical protein
MYCSILFCPVLYYDILPVPVIISSLFLETARPNISVLVSTSLLSSCCLSSLEGKK